MECRHNCGVCCIAPSISSYIPGLPNGKPAGGRCIHLTDNYRCTFYHNRLKVCRDFQAEELVCGKSREIALKILANLEKTNYPYKISFSHFL